MGLLQVKRIQVSLDLPRIWADQKRERKMIKIEKFLLIILVYFLYDIT